MNRLPRGWRRRSALLAVAFSTVGLWTPVGAEEGPLPDSCRPHPVHLVNPGCVPALTEPVVGPLLDPPETYPDLTPHVTWVFPFRPFVSFDPNTNEFTYGPPELSFDSWSQNVGSVALDLMSDDPTNIENPTVSQCVAWTADVCRARRQVGGFELHPEHNHFHFNEFARYELRTLLSDGTPDYSASGLLDISEKVSFCLVDSTRIRDDARPVPTYVSCGFTREGISAGWADIYSSDLPGQQLSPAGGITDGRYALVITMDYADRVYESDNTNNVIEVTVEVANGATTASIVGIHRP